jgi:hypothetical protein
MFKVYMFLALFGVLGGVFYGGYSYYKDTQARISQLTANNATLKAANETNQATITELQATAVLQAELTQDLQKNLQKAEAYQDKLIGQLRKHDLTKLSLKKPGLIETRINDGTQKLFDSIESDTAK